MKKIISIISSAAISFFSAATMGQTPFILNGKIGQLPAPAKAYLMYKPIGGKQTNDSTTINNGVFTFKGTIEQPEMAYLVINTKGTGLRSKAGRFIPLYLDFGSFSVTSPDSIANAKVSGSTFNTDLAKLDEAIAPIIESRRVVIKQYKTASAAQKKSKEFIAQNNAKMDSLERVQKEVYLSYIKANPNSMTSILALKKYAGYPPNFKIIEPIFNTLSPKVTSSKMGLYYAADIAEMKRTVIGTVAPDFTQADTAGRSISLHDYKGKYVLVDFWASWCMPCRAENPNVVAAYAKYKDKGFNILGVSLDQANTKKNWIKAIHDDHLIWTQVSDLQGWENQASKLYSVKAIPQNFLIDPNGKIVATNIRGNQLNEKLKEIFGAL